MNYSEVTPICFVVVLRMLLPHRVAHSLFFIPFILCAVCVCGGVDDLMYTHM